MRKGKIYQLFAVALGLTLASCSSDDLPGITPDDNVSPKDAVYMNVTVQLPVGSGSRSITNPEGGSSDGTEVGLDYENDVKSVLLVLAEKDDNKFIGCAEKSESLEGKDGKVTAVQSISKSVLSAYYGGESGTLAEAKQQVNVFVFCNPTGALRTYFANITEDQKATWFDEICSINESASGVADNETIWGGLDHKGGFLMSSFEIATKKLPAKFSDWENFTTVTTPFKLTGENSNIGGNAANTIDNGNAIKVERSVARFDFKDGSPTTTPANTYDVVKEYVEVTDGDEVTEEEKVTVQIELTRMALVNMSKNFYYLRRVSADGKPTNVQLCGLETDANYVVDTDAEYKTEWSNVANKKYSTNFNFCLGHEKSDANSEWTIDETARTQWYNSKISDVLAGTEDNPAWTPAGYRIWRYVTENTIPGGVENQKNGISTGVVFKGLMKAPEGATGSLADVFNNATGNADTDPILYVFGNEIFVTWKEVRATAISRGSGDPLFVAAFGTDLTNASELKAEKAAEGENPAVEPVYSNDPSSPDYLWNEWQKELKAEKENDAKSSSDALKAFKKAATGADYTIYQSSKDGDKAGYYCYYYYWNRHNDNSNNGVMGAMEFGVVRNNVYKLAVTNIKRLGHPRISENDPDPEKPEDPDEKGDVYLSVSCEVMPWVVRVNNIEF